MVDKGEYIKSVGGVCRVISVDRSTGCVDVEYVSGELLGKKVVLSGREVRELAHKWTGESATNKLSVRGGTLRVSSALFWFTGFVVARRSGLWFFVGDPVRDLFLSEWQSVFGSPLPSNQRGVTLHSVEHDKLGCQGRVIFRATTQEKDMVDQHVGQIIVEDMSGNVRRLSVRVGSGRDYWNVNSTSLLWFWGQEFGLCPPSTDSIEKVRERVSLSRIDLFEQGVKYGLRA